MKQSIEVHNQFIGFHAWATCPFPEVAFLKDRHRHVFHVYVTAGVAHADRALEFFMLQRDIRSALEQLYNSLKVNVPGNEYELGNRSCETVCLELYEILKTGFKYNTIKQIKVSEDNESFGIVDFD